MKRLINCLTASLLMLLLVFAAVACAYGSAGAGSAARTDSGAEESARASERLASNADVTDILVTEASETETWWKCGVTDEAMFVPTTKPVPTTPVATTKPAKTTKPVGTMDGTVTDTSDDGTATMTLEIDEVGDGWFTACHPWPSPLKYKVIYDLDGRFKSGDNVEVGYAYDEFDSSGEPIVLHALSVSKSDFEIKPGYTYKPVIYLYPEKKTDVSVRLRYNGVFTSTVPEYGNGWNVTAYPDGLLVNGDGAKYPYLFWEGRDETVYDLSSGFCVRGGDSESFLREKLAYMGMSAGEIEDFLSFWLPHLEKSPYNRICFQTTAYTDNAELLISPRPDSVLRVFMVYTPLETPVKTRAQTLKPFERTGFVAVEWGGALVAE